MPSLRRLVEGPFRGKDGHRLSDAKKNDGGKERYDLIPAEPLLELARVYTMGAVKYGDYNWMGGFRFGRVFAAMMRHAWKFWRGERYDQEDGQPHLASVAWCAFTLMYYDFHTDRYKELDLAYR